MFALPGTALHREGKRAFPDAGARKSKTKRARSDAIKEEIRQNTAAIQAERRTVREQLLSRKKAGLAYAEARAKEILATRHTLANIPGCRWSAIRHTCPALVLASSSEDASRVADRTGQISNLAGEWVRRHHGVSSMGPSKQQLPRPTACYELGMCVCGPKNRRLRQFQTASLTHLKRSLAPKHRTVQLRQGHVIVAWVSPAVSRHQEDMCLFGYVALQYMSPWRPTYLLLEHVNSIVAGQEQRQLRLALLLLASERPGPLFTLRPAMDVCSDSPDIPSFRTAAEICSTMDLDRIWHMRLLELADSDRAADFCAGHVRATLLNPDIEATKIWDEAGEGPGAALSLFEEALDVPNTAAVPEAQENQRLEEDEEDEEQNADRPGERDLQDAGENAEGVPEAPMSETEDFCDDLLRLLSEADNATAEQSTSSSSSSSSSGSSSSSTSSSSSDSSSSNGPPSRAQSPVSARSGDGQDMADQLDEQDRPLRGRQHVVQPETFRFGRFLITHRPPNTYQATCRYHNFHAGTRCTKSGTWRDGDGEGMRDVVRRLKSWCLIAPACEDKATHQGRRILPAMRPEHANMTDAELEAAERELPEP